MAEAGQVLTLTNSRRIQIMHNGLRVPANDYYGPWMTSLIERCHGHHEPQQEQQFYQALQALPMDATMIELGGYWSYYTAWFLQGAPHRRAVVLEPDPGNQAVGERTMALNDLSVTFVSGMAGGTPAPARPFLTERSGIHLVPRSSVPQLMEQHNIEQLHMLHCDIEGMELDVLEGCRNLFKAGRITFAFVSTHVHQVTRDPLTHHRCLEILRDCGAVIEAEHDAYESFSGDGLIVARFGKPLSGWKLQSISRARRNAALFRDPCFDLAELMQAMASSARIPASPLLDKLQEYGRVYRAGYSKIGKAVIIDGPPAFQSDGLDAGFLVYGPYCACMEGSYECAFLLRLDTA